MQDYQLIGWQGACRISTAFVIAELNFKYAGGENLNDRPNLSTV